MFDILTQAIGFVGTGLMIVSYQCNKSRNLFLLQMASNVAYIIHFIMLNALTGSISIFLGLIRNRILSVPEKKWAQWKGWMPLIIVLNVITTIVTWKDMFSILPCLGMVTMTIFSWSRNGKKIRMANFLVNSPSWLIYDIHTHSISGIFAELFCMSSIIISFVRYGTKALDGDGE